MLDRTLARMGVPAADALSTVFDGWAEIVGPDLAAHSRPVALRDGCLVVVADDPARASRLRWDSPRILTEIDARTTDADVVEVRVRVDRSAPSEDR